MSEVLGATAWRNIWNSTRGEKETGKGWEIKRQLTCNMESVCVEVTVKLSKGTTCISRHWQLLISYSVGGGWINKYGALVEWHWLGKIEVRGEKSVPVLLCQSHNNTWSELASNFAFRGEGRRPNHLRHGTARHGTVRYGTARHG